MTRGDRTDSNRTQRRSTTSGRASTARVTSTRSVGSRGRPVRRTSKLRWVARILAVLLVLGLSGALAVMAVIRYYSTDLPDVRSLRDVTEAQTTRVVDRNGVLLGELFTERRTVVPIDRIPRVLVLSVLAAEDADFYQHEGFDYAGLVRAVVRGVLAGGRFRGTSTITQQLVKNMLLSSERSFARKIRELILAYRIEQEFTKDEILELYLNHINFGHGRYGVQEAARFYFDKDVSELTLAEAALLAGIPQSPTHLSPRTNPEAAERRRAFVLRQLAEKRESRWPDLDPESIAEAERTPLQLAPPPESNDVAPEIVEMARRTLADLVGASEARSGGYTVHVTIDVNLQREARTALQEGLREYDRRHRLTPPFRRPQRRRGERARPLDRVASLRVGGTYDAMVTDRDDDLGTIGLDIGGHAGVASVNDLARFNPDGLPAGRFVEEGARVRVSILSLPVEQEEGEDEREGDEGEEGERVAQVPSRVRARLELGPEGALILLDARSRDVLALVGGYEAIAGFNRAVQARRQPGSTFKPFVYALGIRSRRFTASSILLDAPGVYGNWQPRNYEGDAYRGPIRLREALAISSNVVAARLMEELGSPAVVAFAHELGFTTDLAAPGTNEEANAEAVAQGAEDTNMALALGAREVRPIELANAYAVFADSGRFAPWRLVSRIEGPSGADVPLPDREAPHDVLTEEEAYVVTSLLGSVVAPGGTGARARELGRPIAGKTGTSNDARDAWFAGYTPDVVGVVWIGYDDQRTLGARETGGRSALPVWVRAMRAASEGRPRSDFVRPASVLSVTIDQQSGLLPYPGQSENTMEEVFLDGTAPTTTADDPGVLDLADFLMRDDPGGDPARSPEPGGADDGLGASHDEPEP